MNELSTPMVPARKRAKRPPSLSLTQLEIRHEAAIRAFWSDHPLNLAYRQKHGEGTFRLTQFKSFVAEMPNEEFIACMFSAGVIR